MIRKSIVCQSLEVVINLTARMRHQKEERWLPSRAVVQMCRHLCVNRSVFRRPLGCDLQSRAHSSSFLHVLMWSLDFGVTKC